MADVRFCDLRLERRLCAGAFGEVFEAVHVRSGRRYAVKVERDAGRGQLRVEHGIYRRLAGALGFVAGVHGFEAATVAGRPTAVLVMDLLGPSLEALFERCGRRFSLKTVLQLGDLMLTRLEFLHHKGFVHRDVKPDNFAFGRTTAARQLFLLDFGLARAYRSGPAQQHAPPRAGRSMVGTARYASLNAHRGLEQSRRDDIEALMHCLLYFACGRLPWQGLPGSTKHAKFRAICEAKARLSLRELTEGLDPVFLRLFEHARHLGYEDKPDYVQLRQMLAEAMKRNRLRPDYVFDWDETKTPFTAEELEVINK